VRVDIAEPMLAPARERDPEGDYRRVPDGDLTELEGDRYDLILSAFTFDNVQGEEKRIGLLEALRRVLAEEGRVINLVSAPEIYRNEWASFSAKDFPENRLAESGCGSSCSMSTTGDPSKTSCGRKKTTVPSTPPRGCEPPRSTARWASLPSPSRG